MLLASYKIECIRRAIRTEKFEFVYIVKILLLGQDSSLDHHWAIFVKCCVSHTRDLEFIIMIIMIIMNLLW